MHTVGSVVLAILLVGFLDWLIVTRLAAYFTEFDYQYWPLPRARRISLLVAICTITLLVIFVRPDPENPPLWALVPFGIVLILWLGVGYRDILIQRRAGNRTPARYSDSDY